MGFLLVFNQTIQAEETVNDLLEKAIYSPYERALGYIDQALGIEPENAVVYIILTSKHLEADELEQALDAINRAIALSPDDEEAYRWRATVRRKMGDEEEADKDVVKSKEARKARFKADLARSKEKRTARNPKDIKKLRGEIYGLIHKKNYQAAINLFEQYIEIVKKPKNQTILISIASAYEQVNDLSSAIEIYTKCIEWYSPDADFYQRRARLKEKMGDTAGAAMDNAVVVSMGLEKRKERVAGYDKAIEKNPGNKSAYVEKAKELVEFGEFEAALEAMDEALALPLTNIEDWEQWIVRFRRQIKRRIEYDSQKNN
jgi:tetratricopeptide (TPR) repeat protein